MVGTTIDPEVADPCDSPRSVVENYASRLTDAPTPEVGAAYQVFLSESRFTYQRCMQVSLGEAQDQQIRGRDAHLGVVNAIYYGGANYSGR